MVQNVEEELVPFLKWAGGKRWLVNNHADLLPTTYNRYIEPFLGGGSVFFHLRPENAILGDLNSDLIDAYRGIQQNWRALQNSLAYRQRAHREDPDYYYRQRSKNPQELLQKASRLIYLNRTCFNGIYRVNREGQFNVPRGSKNKVVLENDDFETMARLLEGVELRVSDFQPLIDEAADGDLVFADPPYTVLHNNNGFVKYNEVLFSWSDQQRLANSLRNAARRGVQVVCTNANHQSVRELYDTEEFELKVVSRFSAISADSASRKYFEELIIQANI
ncbi:Dam family site-specific DNA-(adenine-N6)-methyltransferase [Ralstonia insidiosa]|uniref:Site-specific DNA-methyltransferase (adenine-specific) n=2 Tax=Ralstonia insidiosa TaxID=190721 RepID=A0A848P8R6_9RALS|nr:Dam family site-specific DNA-(adenine-N6)-methyltransferase [Ralstonia insidiosa]NMV41857.1 Dam family site-specific DNA-(adenine-N6)-methyltransferase [Ralstonia insidiosa]